MFFFRMGRAEANEFTQNEHLGTHMDAPRHFVENGETIEQIGMERLHGPGKKHKRAGTMV